MDVRKIGCENSLMELFEDTIQLLVLPSAVFILRLSILKSLILATLPKKLSLLSSNSIKQSF
jgi:hypothetical protein